MRIIEDNLTKENNIARCTCEYCKSVLDVDMKQDVLYDNGRPYFVCPICNEDSYSEELYDDFPTKDEIKFPNRYYYFGNGYEMSDEEIDKYVKDIIEKFNDYDDDDYVRYAGTGDTIIFVFKDIEEKTYVVYVCKNYYEAEVKMKGL